MAEGRRPGGCVCGVGGLDFMEGWSWRGLSVWVLLMLGFGCGELGGVEKGLGGYGEKEGGIVAGGVVFTFFEVCFGRRWVL